MNFAKFISAEAVPFKANSPVNGVNYYGDTGDSLGQTASDILEMFGFGTNRTNRIFNANESQLSREHQIKMAQNAYQWAVEDMRKAGLNPALMYASGGNGASAPSGAMASAGGSSGTGKAMDILGSVASIINSVNGARNLDLKAKELNMKGEQNSMTRRTSTQIYNRLGNIVRQVVSTTN